MDQAARADLEKRLSEMKLRDAMREMRVIDPNANMVYWRNSIWDEYRTRFLLPNEQVQITLIEKGTTRGEPHVIGAEPGGFVAQSKDYTYVGARVEPLERPAFKRGGTGPSPMKHSLQGEQEGVYVEDPI